MFTDILLSAGNLPAEPNSFVGRERDLAELAMLLGEVRALTLCGPGGIGKTRLALRLAAGLAPDFPDGTWLAELADLSDPELVPRRVAAALGIREEPDRSLTETLTDALRSRRLLLVLDTCEHLVDASAALVQQLLAGCRWVRVVATSREPLRVRGETVWRVPPLELPTAVQDVPIAELLEHEAIRLFTDRAAAVRAGFQLGADNAEAVTRLCRMLDGIPLAIELAAARIRALSVEQVAARLSDRFQLLASGDRTAPLRQQTLRAAVDWSFELLTEPEQALLRRLSVFSGWNLEMAEQVCADEQIRADDVLDLLAALIDKSLVSLDGELAGDARYRLLDTIGEYAADRLAASGEEAAVRRAHRDYLVALAEGIVARAFLRGDPPWPVRVAMYHRIDVERPNFATALAECLARGDAEQGMRLCVAMRSAWVAYGNVTEGISWLDKFLALHEQLPAGIHARGLVHRAELAFEQQDYQAAGDCAQRGLDLIGAAAGPAAAGPAGIGPAGIGPAGIGPAGIGPAGIGPAGDGPAGIGPAAAGAYRVLALVSLRAGHPDQALASIDAGTAAARAAGDYWEEGLGLATRAAVIARLGRLDEAQQAFESALETLRDNNGWGIAQTQYGFGALARQRGDAAAALAHFRAALVLYREIDARPEIARCLAGIGWVALSQLDLELAASSLTESIRLSLATGQRLAIARGLDAFAALAVIEDDQARAVKLASAGAALRGGAPRPARQGPPGQASAEASQTPPPRIAALLASAAARLGEPAVSALAAKGAAMSAHEAVALAIGLRTDPGERAGDDGDQARQAPAGGSAPARGAAGNSPAAASPAAANSAAASPGPGNGTPPGLTGSGSLTVRELEIARLVARGLSNRGIAAELTISPATAARHVANIFGKLGFSSRAQVAAWAAERDAGNRY